MSSNLMDTEPGGEQTPYEAENSDVIPHAKLAGQLGGKNPSLTKDATSKLRDDDSDSSRDSTLARKLAGGQQTTTPGISPLASAPPANASPANASPANASPANASLANASRPPLARITSSPATSYTLARTNTQTRFADGSPPLAASSSTESPPLSVSASNSSSFAKHMLETWVADVKAGSQKQKKDQGEGNGSDEADKTRREQGYGGDRDMRRDVGA